MTVNKPAAAGNANAWPGHSHFWLFGVLGIAAGLVLLVYVPSLKSVAASMFLFAGFHVVGGIVLLSTGWYGFLRSHLRPSRTRKEKLDFGWDPGWTAGLFIAALIAFAAAVAVEVAVPLWWPAAWGLLFFAASFFTGFIIMAGYRRADFAVLPVADFLSGPDDLILDAGCGAGRTTIALSPAIGRGRIIAVDRFDASYIEGGGRALLDRNLQLAGLSERVEIQTADLTALPFPDEMFDSIISTNVFDHLGRGKQKALHEAARVLRPGGRFLVGLSVPGWAMFAIGNVLSFALTSKRGWKKMAGRAGLHASGAWSVNGTWFVLLAKPGARRRAEVLAP
jgi:SAM-dependent methyltransferase